MSYGTVNGAEQYWAARNYEGAPSAQLLAAGSLFVDSLGWRMTPAGVPVCRFGGTPADPDQEHAWPRVGATNVYGVQLDSAVVPAAIERATYEAAYYEHNTPGGLNAAVRLDEQVVREKFGPVEFEYADKSSSGVAPSTPIIPSVMALLAPLLSGGANPYGITGVVA